MPEKSTAVGQNLSFVQLASLQADTRQGCGGSPYLYKIFIVEYRKLGAVSETKLFEDSAEVVADSSLT